MGKIESLKLNVVRELSICSVTVVSMLALLIVSSKGLSGICSTSFCVAHLHIIKEVIIEKDMI